MSRLSASDWQFHTGGDGSLESSWTSTQGSAVSIYSEPGHLGEPAVNYVPALNRYLLLTFYYPNGANDGASAAQDCVWLGLEAPHPRGPWTKINTTEWSTQGYYNPIPVLSSGILTGTTSTLMFTHDFFTDYSAYYSTMTIQH